MMRAMFSGSMTEREEVGLIALMLLWMVKAAE